MLRRKTPPVAGPLQIFKCFLIHATAGPHARNCLRAKYRLTCPEEAELFRRNPPRRMRWQENMRCAELAEARCQGVARAKPAWRQTGFDIYFLEFFGTFCFKTKSTIEKYTNNCKKFLAALPVLCPFPSPCLT